MSAPLADLIQAAMDASARAYCPYSGYRVGAVLVAKDGRTFTGCNVENAAYPAGICAERGALMKAISEGAQTFEQLVIATANGGSPCGVCRQMLFEFAPRLRVVCVTLAGAVVLESTLDALLPHGFGPESL